MPTLTGTLEHLDSSRVTGAITIWADVDHVTRTIDNVVMFGGQQKVVLIGGQFSVQLPDTSDPNNDPVGYHYFLRLPDSTVVGPFSLTANTDLSDIVPSASGTIVPVDRDSLATEDTLTAAVTRLTSMLEILNERTTTGNHAHLVGGSGKRLRREFNVLDTTAWVIDNPSDMVLTAGNSLLTVAMGTTPDATASITTVDTFSAPMRLMVSETLSQKIANNEVYIEVVAVNDNGTIDESRVAAWRISGNDSTTATQASIQTNNGSPSRALLANQTVNSHVNANANAIWEIEVKATETWYHTRTVDSTSSRSNSYVRHSNSPDPNRLFKIRLRWVNGSTPPASATTAYVGHVVIDDYTEIVTEISDGRGSGTAGSSLNVVVTNTPSVSASGTSISTVSSSSTNTSPSTGRNTALTNADVSVKTSAGKLYGLHAYNPNTVGVWLHYYDTSTASTTVGSTSPVMSFFLKPEDTLTIPPAPTSIRHFGTAITMAATTGVGDAVAPTTPIVVNTFFQ